MGNDRFSRRSLLADSAALAAGAVASIADPARAAANLLIWAGVKSVRAIVRVAKPAYEMFSETSAEFGAWLLGHRRAEVEAAVWSRIRH